MNSLTRQTIAITLTMFILAVGIYGTYLPIRKSQLYIGARKTEVKTLVDFNKLYDSVLNYKSPVGQEEVVANYLEIIFEIINQEQRKENPNKDVVTSLVGKAEEWALPIIEKRSGFGFSQILFSMGNVYRSATILLQEEAFYNKAIKMYELGMEFSPDRQIFVYSLFDMYHFANDKANAKRIGERIVRVYQDARIEQILQSL